MPIRRSSIFHGVRPPLSATQKAPCRDTAARARSAMRAAAAPATSVSVGLILISGMGGTSLSGTDIVAGAQ